MFSKQKTLRPVLYYIPWEIPGWSPTRKDPQDVHYFMLQDPRMVSDQRRPKTSSASCFRILGWSPTREEDVHYFMLQNPRMVSDQRRPQRGLLPYASGSQDGLQPEKTQEVHCFILKDLLPPQKGPLHPPGHEGPLHPPGHDSGQTGVVNSTLLAAAQAYVTADTPSGRDAGKGHRKQTVCKLCRLCPHHHSQTVRDRL